MAENEPVSPQQDSVRVRRGRVGSVDLVELKEHELELLEQGPGSLELNFAIFLFSIAFSSLIVLLTATSYRWPLIENVFLILTFAGFVLGAFFLRTWRKSHSSIKQVVKTIRDRIPKNGDGHQDENPPTPPSPA